MNLRAAIPTALTLGNLACGVLAILAQNIEILGFQWQETNADLAPLDVSGVHSLTHLTSIIWPVWLFIGLAAVFDFLDGFVARLLRVESPLGVQLDSLADLVSFGVAPAVYLFETGFRPQFLSGQGLLGYLYLIASVLLPLAAGYRLARFNVGSGLKGAGYTHFEGLPAPAAGLMVVGTTMALHKVDILDALHGLTAFATAATISLAMVSRWPFLSFKGSTRERLALVAVFAAGALIVWLTDWQPWVVLATLALYAVVSRVLITPVRRAAQ